MPPPPVPWRTKPHPNQQRTPGSPQAPCLCTLCVSQPSDIATCGLVPVYIHPNHLPDIEAALRFLGLPPLLNPGGDHSQATTLNHEENCNHPVSPRFQQRSNPQPENEDELDYLSSSFSQLSTLGSSSQAPQDLFPAQRPPVVKPNPSPRKDMKKYYVVVIGKCTGVFWEEW